MTTEDHRDSRPTELQLHRAFDELSAAIDALHRVDAKDETDPMHNARWFQIAGDHVRNADVLQRSALENLEAPPLELPEAPRPLRPSALRILSGRRFEKERALEQALEIHDARQKLTAHLTTFAGNVRRRMLPADVGAEPVLGGVRTEIGEGFVRPTHALALWWALTVLLVFFALVVQVF